MIYINKSNAAQIPVGTCLPLHVISCLINDLNDYIRVGYASSFADRFHDAVIEYVAELPTKNKTISVQGILTISGTDSSNSIIDSIIENTKVVPGEKLKEYLNLHCTIGKRYEQVYRSYRDLISDIELGEARHSEEINNGIDFLEEQLEKYDKSRRQINNDLFVNDKKIR